MSHQLSFFSFFEDFFLKMERIDDDDDDHHHHHHPHHHHHLHSQRHLGMVGLTNRAGRAVSGGEAKDGRP